MNKIRFGSVSLLALLLVTALLPARPTALAQSKTAGQDDAHAEQLCPLRFEGTVHQGANAEKFSLIGVLDLRVASSNGKLDGYLVLDTGFRVPAHGQLNGRAINFLFDLGSDVSVIGIGTVLTSRGEHGCLSLKGGGIFTGPNQSDVGSWLISFFGGGGGGSNCTTPIIKNPTFNANGRLKMENAGSCIMDGATLTVKVPFSTTTHGPFSLQ